jgi:hypothetical protein
MLRQDDARRERIARTEEPVAASSKTLLEG